MSRFASSEACPRCHSGARSSFVPQPLRGTGMFGYTTAASTASQEQYEEFSDQLDSLEDLLRKLNHERINDAKQVAGLVAELASDRRHSAQTAELTTKLLCAQGNLAEKFALFESSILGLVAKGLQQGDLDRIEGNVRSLTRELQQTVEQLAADSDVRLTEQRVMIEALAKRLDTLERDRGNFDRLSAITDQLQHAQDGNDARAARVTEEINTMRVTLVKYDSDIADKIHRVKSELDKELRDGQLTLHEAIHAVEKRLGEQNNALANAEHRLEDVVQFVTSVDTTSKDKYNAALSAIEEFRATNDRQAQIVAESVKTVENDLQHLADVVESIEQASQKASDKCVRQIEDVVASVRALESRVQIEHTQRQTNIDLIRTDFEAVFRQMITAAQRETQHAIDHAFGSVSDDLKKLRTECDVRHDRMVASTHQALHRLADVGDEVRNGPNTARGEQFSLLKEDIMILKEVVATHKKAIDEVRANTINNTAALEEVRDWMNDLNSTQAPRGGVEEALMTLSSQLSTMKQQMQSHESTFTQRLIKECSTRENDVAELRSHLHRLSTSSRLPGSVPSPSPRLSS